MYMYPLWTWRVAVDARIVAILLLYLQKLRKYKSVQPIGKTSSNTDAHTLDRVSGSTSHDLLIVAVVVIHTRS